MAYKLTSMKRGEEPQGQTLKNVMAKSSPSMSMPANKSVDVKPVKVNPKSRKAILVRATPEEIAANKTKSQSYNYDDARKRAQAQNKRVQSGSNEKMVQGKDVEKEMKTKRKQFRNSYYAGTIDNRSDLRDSIRTTFPKGTTEKEVRSAMPWSATGEVLRTVKKVVKKGVKQNVIAPVGGLVRKVTTAQMNKGCPPKGQ